MVKKTSTQRRKTQEVIFFVHFRRKTFQKLCTTLNTGGIDSCTKVPKLRLTCFLILWKNNTRDGRGTFIFNTNEVQEG
jgi:hypothetical protein